MKRPLGIERPCWQEKLGISCHQPIPSCSSYISDYQILAPTIFDISHWHWTDRTSDIHCPHDESTYSSLVIGSSYTFDFALCLSLVFGWHKSSTVYSSYYIRNHIMMTHVIQLLVEVTVDCWLSLTCSSPVSWVRAKDRQYTRSRCQIF